MLQAIAGYDPRDRASVRRAVPSTIGRRSRADVRGLRIGVIRHFWEEDLKVSDEVARAMERAMEHFRQLGATLEDVSHASLTAVPGR